MRKNKNAALRKPDILESYYQVLIQEGLEGASIGKIADLIGIHPSLIIHYFKNKENLKLELVDLLIEKYESPAMLDFDHIGDAEAHFNALMDVIFSLKWSRTVEPSVHFAFFYLSLRDEKILDRFKVMFKWLRDYLSRKLAYFDRAGVVRVDNPDRAAEYIVTMMEGLEFHNQFLADGEPFEAFSQIAKKSLISVLKNGDL
ncbi:TetR/AcrR family transcriptional regulator [uncultured Desulfosarcina sp.]|uniref:TetR/AcrR family transcriptional regulator n=1 Tax=uncultured Desulfosarcina sp. TaxID=218289 RepID=UPI0029C63B7A|nr:TetR/AcrR family transcriptional regulator [uncultured Desulfosarcina sp.]